MKARKDSFIPTAASSGEQKYSRRRASQLQSTLLSTLLVALLVAASPVRAQTATAPAPGTGAPKPAKKYQAKAPQTQPFGAPAFAPSATTTLRWLGMAGFFINSRGTTLMVDPLLEGFDMPLLITFPIAPKDVPHLDAVLVTHADNDHFSVPTNQDLKPVTKVYHATVYVDSLLHNLGLPAVGHGIGEQFAVGPLRVTTTAADHAYQNAYPGISKRRFKNEDACGFLIETPDGTIWAPGDSRLLPQHLTMPAPDAILFDFSDSEWHFTLAGAVKIANAYPNTVLLLNHWGSVDAPGMTPFNGDPQQLAKLVTNPQRIRVLAPGEPFTLHRLKTTQSFKRPNATHK
jgi:L-ascorbate metabolism protein UlaG (beta-lactamase superfamily)